MTLRWSRRKARILLGSVLIWPLVCAPLLASAQQSLSEFANARELVEQQHFPEAEAVLRAYLEKTPASADAHYLLAYVFFKERRPDDSLKEASEGAKYRRPKADELTVVASDYVLAGDYANAKKWFIEVTKETPENAMTWYLLGRTQYNASEFADAVASFQHCLALHPRYVEAEDNIGLAYREQGDSQKAIDAFRTAIAWQDDHPWDAQPFLNLGTVLRDQNRAEEASSFLLQAEKLAPDNPTVHEELGALYAKQGRVKDEQAELEKAVSLAPSASSLHFKLGQLYRREGQTDKAQQEFAACSRLNATHSSTKTPNPLTASGIPK